MRKIVLRTLLLTVLLFSLLSASAYADTATVTGDDVNLRSGPGVQYEVLGCYSKGTEVIVHDRSNAEWYSVTIDGVRGFMASNYLEFNDGGESAPAPAEIVVTGEETGYINAMYVRFRTGASLDASILGEYNNGTAVTINGTAGDWTAVTINGTRGYVFSSYVSRGTPNAGTQPAEEPAAPEQPAAPADGTNASLCKDDVYLYCDPSYYSDIKGAFSKGDRLIVNEVNGDWATVSIQGYPGYIHKSNISMDDSQTPAAQPTPVPQPTPAPAPQPTPTPAPQPTPTPAPETPTDGTNAVLCRDDVYLYNEPSFYSDIRGAFSKGERLTVNDMNGDWATVIIQGYPGYIFKDNISEDSKQTTGGAAVSTESKSGHVNADHVHLRSGPSTSSAIKGIFNKNDSLTITGASGDWVAVTVQGMQGYIYKSYVTADAAETPAPTPEPTPAPTETPQPAPAETTGEDGYIKGNSVNLRAEPSINGEILGTYNSGKKLTITGASGDWTAVVIDGKSGYVYSSYVGRGEIVVTTPPDTGDEGVQMANFALQFVGYPYVWAGTSPDVGFDCSGLAYYTYTHFGYSMYRVANDQTRNGVHVDASELQPGDLLCFYSGGSYVGHVGIYIGGGKFVHASTYTTGVIISELGGYYTNRGFEARRIAGTSKDGPGDN